MKTFEQLSEDLQKRRQELRQRQLQQMQAQKQKIADYQSAQGEKRRAAAERESLKKEIKRELQTEQTPTMEPNLYNKLIARSQLSRKKAREAHAQREMEHEASAQQAQKRREMRAIMSR